MPPSSKNSPPAVYSKNLDPANGMFLAPSQRLTLPEMDELDKLTKKELLELLTIKTDQYIKLMRRAHSPEEIEVVGAELTRLINEIRERPNSDD